MTVLIVGADRIKAFVPKLKNLGVQDVLHWDTRNCRASKNRIPINTDLVICCTDFLNHNAARQIKEQIKKRDLPAVYCRRAWSELAPELELFMQKKQLEKQSKTPEKKKKPCVGCKNCRCGK